ncbi:MAG: hypothetical protein P4L22_03485 [Candidatus Babeliales bacterium]|nr:hypothetical protein [Candidatus Babeliales bacterium]
MNFSKLLLFILLTVLSNSYTQSYHWYVTKVEQYNQVPLEAAKNFKDRLAKIDIKLTRITEILINVIADNIFETDINRILSLTPEQTNIKTFLMSKDLNLDNLKNRKDFLINEKKALGKYEIFYDIKDYIVEKIDNARKTATTVGDFASGTFIAYGFYDLYFNRLEHSLKDFLRDPNLIRDSKSSIIQKTTVILAMIAISSHYLGK